MAAAVAASSILLGMTLGGCTSSSTSSARTGTTTPATTGSVTTGSSTAASAATPGTPTPSDAGPPPSLPATGRSAAVPRPAHTLVVVMENHGYDSVVGSADAPWLNALPAALLSDWHGVDHPSQANYVAMFTGSTQDITGDHCPIDVNAPSLASQLADAGLTFTGYAEGLPQAGSRECSGTDYVRRHNPWAQIPSLPANMNQPLTALPSDFSRLPTVAFVIPNMCHDTHDCPTSQGDSWLRDTIGPYVTWATTHNSLLIVTYDEDDDTQANHIPTWLVGPMVTPGTYAVHGDHYTLLRTLEDMYGLAPLGTAADRTALTTIWGAH